MSTVETFTFTGVNRPMNADNMTQFEQMHVPGISCPNKVAPGDRFEVAIEVGKLYAHPSEHTHFIEFLDLYADETFLARADLTPPDRPGRPHRHASRLRAMQSARRLDRRTRRRRVGVSPPRSVGQR